MTPVEETKKPGLLQTRFGDLYVFAAVVAAISLGLRTALCIASWRNLDHAPWSLAKAFGMGLFFDGVTFVLCVSPVAIFRVLAPDRVFHSRANRIVSLTIYFLALYVMLFDVVAEWYFWQEFGARFNFVAVDYLVYTQELVANMRQSYPLGWILPGLLVGAAAIWAITLKPILQAFRSTSTFRRRLGPGAALLAAAALALLFVDQSLTNVSGNFFTNELAKNGLYSFVNAFWNNTIEYDQFYLTRDDKAVFERLRKLLAADNARFVSEDPFDITRDVTNPGPEMKYNIAMIVVESLSGEFLTEFGSKKNLTPNLDDLTKKGLFFRNLYATGTRTDRGLEALSLSVPPTPGRSLFKRPHSEGLFSIGGVLAPRGYDRMFLCGGYNYFDNMGGFFTGIGFRAVDRSNLSKDEITFENAWGVCDEDLFARMVKECDRSFEGGKPFLCITMTTSNHRPFTFPPNPQVSGKQDRAGAVRYTDYAIGKLLREAQTHAWFDDTIFVIVADHCAGSAGKSEVPVDKYHIPLLIYAPKIVQPAVIDRLASQIDVAPTLLGLLHLSYRSKFYGRDVLADSSTSPSSPGRALIGNYQKVGLYTPGFLTLLLPRREAKAFKVNGPDDQPEAPLDEEHLMDAIAYYQSASYLFRHRLFQAE
jgi:phosphoglycerol transferase MdoB-like AlkP superfamily enzyme